VNGRKDNDHLKGPWLLVFLVASLYLLVVHPAIISPSSSTLRKDLLMSQSHSTVFSLLLLVCSEFLFQSYLSLYPYHHSLFLSVYCSNLKTDAVGSSKFKHLFIRLQPFTSHKTVIFLFTALRTSYPKQKYVVPVF
jgi:hypothetical protein